MLEKLDPKPVWKYFEQFCGIPHPSGYEEKAVNFIIDCATALGLSAITDATGNVLVRKAAKNPSDNRATVVLQSHLDMVPQKNNSTEHDFRKDPIRPWIDGEWVKARDTTLGADNGIGVALALAVLENKDINHGPIEALFTLDEERGMTGALGLVEGFLAGRKMINLDTENEHEICIGCAGGTDIIATLPASFTEVDNSHAAHTISVTGLRGGHSGMEIHLNRGNALKIMNRLLVAAASACDLRIADLHGGSARNAIPREAFATVTIPSGETDAFTAAIGDMRKTIATSLTETDADFTVTVTAAARPERVTSLKSRDDLIAVLSECPYGVQRMSDTMDGAVETSNNLSVVSVSPDAFRIECMLRSSSDERLEGYRNRITTIFTDRGASVDYGSNYPGWQPDPQAALLAVMKSTHNDIYGKDPDVVAVHAGLECGIIGARFPGMEMISCGPTIRFAHSPDEQMHIPSVERFWRWLVAGLERL